MNRQDLIDKLSLLQPALATNNFLQILTHFWFDGETAVAYNDRIGITVMFKDVKPGFKGCVPGNTLLGLLRSSTAADVMLTEDDGWFVIKTKVIDAKLAMIPIKEAKDVWDIRKLRGDHKSLGIPANVLIPALVRCLCSTTDDTSTPDQLGVTFIPNGDDTISLYATDNNTLTRVIIDGELDERVIVSAEFCRQVVALVDRNSKKPVDLRITSTYALLTTDKAVLYGKLIESEKPVPFENQFKHHFPNNLRGSLVGIPKFMAAALERSLVMAAAGEGEARMTIECKSNRFKCVTSAVVGQDTIGTITDSIDLKHPDVKASLRPKDVKSGMEFYTKMLVTSECLVMCDDANGTFLVATSAK